jgi:serine/threonine protein kinase
MTEPLELADLVPGTQLGHYIISERIAQGGMGTVFRATEPALERFVAIKVLRPEYASNPEYVQYFQDEARAVAALRHPNIVPIFFIGQEGNVVFFSMAFIEGETFDDWIEKQRWFTEAHAKWFLSHAIAALHSAHKANIVHLDIKPANFLVDRANNIMLTDFGLAEKIVKAEGEGDQREAFGTPAYVSPEQIMRSKTDQRTDIYSLGATLFHLMTGRIPFEGPSVEEMVWGHLEKPFPLEVAQKANVPVGWTHLLRKMMARDPEKRFADYRQLREAFEHVQDFRWEEEAVAHVAPERPITLALPRSGQDSQTLHGILARTKSPWTVQEQKSSGMLQHTRAAVLDAMKTRLEPLKVDALVGTLGELCQTRIEDPSSLAEAMEKVPGYAEAVRALYDFMTNSAAETAAPTPPKPVDLLETIGLERGRYLALTFFALNYEVPQATQFDWTPLWRHQLAVGVMIDFFHDALNLKRSGLEYVTGLAHDIGKLILSELFPFAYFTILHRAFQEKESLSSCEQKTFGLDHAELGGLWLKQHGLPAPLIEAVALHETAEKIQKKQILAHALVSANHLAQKVGLGYSGNPLLDPRPWEELPSTRLIWEARGNKAYPFEDFTRDFLDQFQNFPDLV